MKKLSQILELGAPKLTSLLSNFSGLKTLSSRLEKPKREKNVAEPDSALAFKSADLVEPEGDAIAATEAVQLAQAEAQAATDTDAGGVLFGGDGGVTTATATGSVGIGVGSVFATGALLRNSGSNGSGQVAPSGGSAVNPGGNEPLEEINSLGMDFTAREVTTPGVSIKTTAAGEIKGTATVGAIYTDVDVQKRTLTVDNTQVDESTRVITAASSVKVMADGFIDLISLSSDATFFIDDFVFDPAFAEGEFGQLFGQIGLQASNIELTSKNSDVMYFLAGAGSTLSQRVPDSTTTLQSISIDYDQSESVSVEALNGTVDGILTVARFLDVTAQTIQLGIIVGEFEVSTQVTKIEVIVRPDRPDRIDYKTTSQGDIIGTERVELTATELIDAAIVYAKELDAHAPSVSVDVYGGGRAVNFSNSGVQDRDLILSASESVKVIATSMTESSSVEVMSLAATITTAGADDYVELVNARGVGQVATVSLGDGDDSIVVRSLYGSQPGSDFMFTANSNGTHTLTVMDGDQITDVYTLSGVETVRAVDSISRADVASFILMNGVFTLQPMPDAVA